MSWFYALNNEQKGPVTEQELSQLVQRGTVTGDTLVWKEGLAEWRPYREVAPAPGSPPPISQAAAGVPGGLACGECGRSFRSDEVVMIGGRNICGSCKPIVVQRLKEGAFVGGAAEEIRTKHLSHEASVKSVGFLYILGGGLGSLGGVIMLIVGLAGPGSGVPGSAIVTGILLTGLCVFTLVTGLAVRRLKPWSRVAGIVLSAFGLLAIGLGTIINIYALYLLISEKGRTVFSDDYKRVMAETPHIKYKTSIVVWIVLGLLVLAILAGVVAAFTGGVRR